MGKTSSGASLPFRALNVPFLILFCVQKRKMQRDDNERSCKLSEDEASNDDNEGDEDEEEGNERPNSHFSSQEPQGTSSVAGNYQICSLQL